MKIPEGEVLIHVEKIDHEAVLAVTKNSYKKRIYIFKNMNDDEQFLDCDYERDDDIEMMIDKWNEIYQEEMEGEEDE